MQIVTCTCTCTVHCVRKSGLKIHVPVDKLWNADEYIIIKWIQQTAFTGVQDVILQSLDFILRVEPALKVTYP